MSYCFVCHHVLQITGLSDITQYFSIKSKYLETLTQRKLGRHEEEEELIKERENSLGTMKRSTQNQENSIMGIIVEDTKDAKDDAKSGTIAEDDIAMVEEEMKSIAKLSTYSSTGTGRSQVGDSLMSSPVVSFHILGSLHCHWGSAAVHAVG